MSSTEFFEISSCAGLEVLLERVPGARSAAVGFFVATGSRDESPEIAGLSHFLEHMAFKTTKRRSAAEVSLALDRCGSKANAYTSWERTAFFARVLPEYAPEIAALLAEMIDPAFALEDFETEKRVILEEIEMYNDRPDFLLFERIMEARFAGHPLARRILGSRQTIADVSLERMRQWHRSRYVDSRIVVAVSGPFGPGDIEQWTLAVPAESEAVSRDLRPAPIAVGHEVLKRPDDQSAQYIATWPGPNSRDLRGRIAAGVLEIILGDDEGSRLAWALTYPGIAEGVEAGSFSFQDAGIIFAGFVANPGNYEKGVSILERELADVRGGISDAELERAKTKFASRTVMASESPLGRMSNLANGRLDGLPYMTLREELDFIMSISKQEVIEVAQVFSEPAFTAAIGPFS